MAETEYSVRLVTIITAGQLIAARNIAKRIDPDGGDFTWTDGLSPSGDPRVPATHYWNNWQMTPDQATQFLQDLEDEIPGNFQVWTIHWDPLLADPTLEKILTLSNPPLRGIEPDF